MTAELTMPREHVAQLVEKLDAFGDDCSEGCKQVRADLRQAVEQCDAGGSVTIKAKGAFAKTLANLGFQYVAGRK